MYRGQQTGARDESTQQTAGKSENGQQHSPALKHSAFLGHRQRVNQRRAEQPGNHGGVFYWIPGPPSAPAQLIICPPTAKGYSHSQYRPRHIRPRAGPTCPGSIHPSAQKRGNGKGKDDGKPYVTHIKRRRVQYETDILESRIEISTIGRRQRHDTIERVRSRQHE